MTFALVDDAALRLRMFPEVCDITRPSYTQDSEGWNEPDNAPEDDPVVFADVPSQFSPLAGDTEVRNAAGEFVKASDLLILDGDYAIEETDACITRGDAFDVVAVGRTSYAVYTVLHLERRENAEDAS